MKIYAVGDIHGVGGDVVDTIEQSFNGKPDPNKYIIFLGDYIDRGGYEKETLEKLIAFKQKYPHNSFFLLGNHEYLMLDALKKIYTRNAQEAFLLWLGNGGFTTILSFHPESKEILSSFPSKKGEEKIQILKTCIQKFIEYISQPDVINFFNDMYGRIDIHTADKQRFVLKHAGPAARKNWTNFSEKYYPETKKWKRVWNRCLLIPPYSYQSQHTVLGELYGGPPENESEKAMWLDTVGKEGSYHEPDGEKIEQAFLPSCAKNMQNLFESRVWGNYTNKYSTYKKTRPKFDTVGETINVFGHSIVDEYIIKNQIATCIRPLDAGSYETGKVAMASLINPNVEFTTTNSPITPDNYSKLCATCESFTGLLSHMLDKTKFKTDTPLNKPISTHNKTLNLVQSYQSLIPINPARPCSIL